MYGQAEDSMDQSYLFDEYLNTNIKKGKEKRVREMMTKGCPSVRTYIVAYTCISNILPPKYINNIDIHIRSCNWNVSHVNTNHPTLPYPSTYSHCLHILSL